MGAAGRTGSEKYFEDQDFALIYVVVVKLSLNPVGGGDGKIGRRSCLANEQQKGKQQGKKSFFHTGNHLMLSRNKGMIF
jgi:hypothetical protein